MNKSGRRRSIHSHSNGTIFFVGVHIRTYLIRRCEYFFSLQCSNAISEMPKHQRSQITDGTSHGPNPLEMPVMVISHPGSLLIVYDFDTILSKTQRAFAKCIDVAYADTTFSQYCAECVFLKDETLNGFIRQIKFDERAYFGPFTILTRTYSSSRPCLCAKQQSPLQEHKE